MKSQRTPQSFSRVARFFQDAIVLLRLLMLPRHRALAPARVQRHDAPGRARWDPASRRASWLPFLMGFVLLGAVPTWGGQPGLPAGVPNIYDPEVQARFQAVEVGNLHYNPDFPVVLLVNTTGEQPQALLLGVDARNGKDTWSLMEDPLILIAVFTDATTLQNLYVDAGFMDRGKASGTYRAVDAARSHALPAPVNAVTAPVRRPPI